MLLLHVQRAGRAGVQHGVEPCGGADWAPRMSQWAWADTASPHNATMVAHTAALSHLGSLDVLETLEQCTHRVTT